MQFQCRFDWRHIIHTYTHTIWKSTNGFHSAYNHGNRDAQLISDCCEEGLPNQYPRWLFWCSSNLCVCVCVCLHMCCARRSGLGLGHATGEVVMTSVQRLYKKLCSTLPHTALSFSKDSAWHALAHLGLKKHSIHSTYTYTYTYTYISL